MGLSIVKAPARILERCSARSLCARVWLRINASEGKIKIMQSLASRKAVLGGGELFLKENAFLVISFIYHLWR